MANLFRYLVLTFAVVCILSLSPTNATEFPAPPKVPAKFNSPEEVQQYLGKLHNYYVMVGRPRFGKRANFGEILNRAEEMKTHEELLNEVQTKIAELYD